MLTASQFDFRIPLSICLENGAMDNGYSHVSNLNVPAGYTYLMQFISHDITYNISDPRLNLSSVYGGNLTEKMEIFDKGLFKLGKYFDKKNFYDFERDSFSKSNIVDRRNEMTLMVMQIHLLFMHFHNKIYANLKGNPNKRFLLARAIVEASYRVIILNDILPLILSDEEMGKLRKGCHFWNHYDVNKEFVQFHAAVFRFGHSMVQPSYRLNESYQATLIRKMNDGFQDDLKGDTPLEEKLIIDWRHFFNFENPMCIQYSSKINTKICRPLFHVFQSSESNPLLSSIAYRTLVLNYKLELPNAKAVLNHFGITPQLNDNHFTDLEYKLDDVPLWLYILKEAEIEMYGTKLGKLGSLLTARTFHHLLSLYDMDKEAIIATAFFSKKQISITDIINYTLN